METVLEFDRRPAILVVAALTVVGALSGALAGAVAAVIFAIVGLLWGLGLVLVARRLSRVESRRLAWSNGVLFAGVLCAGLAGGAGIMAELVMSAALPDSPEFFTQLIRGSIGTAEALPFYMFNTPVEWILMPAALLLTWRNRRRRNLILAAFAVWYVHRIWTYAYFVPLITDWHGSDAPLTAEQIDQAGRWVGLSWFRSAMDIATTVLLLLAAFIPARQDNSG